ncbi:MAG: hypothetical protein OES24_12615 [Acidimicrobiia bacterium]|nr:hypothetical protein [Acidimicrobiia bacterium]
MGFLPTIRQRFQTDLQYRLGLVAYVPILCLGVLAAGGLVFLPGSTGVRVYGIFALLGVGVSALVAHRTIKSVLDSLDRVAGSARELVSAQEALLDNNGEPIEAWRELDESSQDELGFLASAVNAMHRNTLEIDRNQNASIRKGISNIVINLARRSQALLDRQVEYIDQLESTEEDPDRLEQMFKVDHLATRMRRNAESLLVLAEADPGRRRGGPVDVADVLRVAMGEIENYQHIDLTSIEPGQVTSAAAVDLAHMAAELMENATQFSPPEAPVEVSGRLVDGQYLVSIIDHGVGMPDDQLIKANATLTDPPELGLAMGRSLGFVVIGRLAQRVGARVDLIRTANSGITARIAVPTSVFTEVGDNSGVRRSVLVPETPQPEAPVVEEDQSQNRSPALSKLLGLDVASLAGGGNAAAPVAAPATGTPAAPAPDDAQDTWTPPPVTPDAPIALPPEVAALAEAVPRDQGWIPPAVSPDANATPLADRSTASPPPSSTAPEAMPIDQPSMPAAEPGAPGATTAPQHHVVADPSAAELTPDARTPTPIDDGSPWSTAAASREPAETVAMGRPPSNLEDALPTGQAFESGMAALLDEHRDEDQAPSAPATEPANPTGPDSTMSGLTRRKRGQSRVPIGEGRPVAASTRNPEEIRSMLSRYRDGIKGKGPLPRTVRRDDGSSE